ncbi:MAG: transcriptional regulator [Candidatus Bathyarchaeota archaeon]
MSITRDEWLAILPVLKSEKRFQLLEYFNTIDEKKNYSTIKEETDSSDGNLSYHLNLLLSAGLIENTTQKTEFGRRPYSYYSITEKGKEVLQLLE